MWLKIYYLWVYLEHIFFFWVVPKAAAESRYITRVSLSNLSCMRGYLIYSSCEKPSLSSLNQKPQSLDSFPSAIWGAEGTHLGTSCSWSSLSSRVILITIQKVIFVTMLCMTQLPQQAESMVGKQGWCKVRGPGTFYLSLICSGKLPLYCSIVGATFTGILSPWCWYKSKGSRVLRFWTSLQDTGHMWTHKGICRRFILLTAEPKPETSPRSQLRKKTMKYNLALLSPEKELRLCSAPPSSSLWLQGKAIGKILGACTFFLWSLPTGTPPVVCQPVSLQAIHGGL